MLRPKPELYGIILFSNVGNVPGREVRIPINQPVQLRFVVFWWWIFLQQVETSAGNSSEGEEKLARDVYIDIDRESLLFG